MQFTNKRKQLTEETVKQLFQRMAEDASIAHYRKEFMIVLAVALMTEEEYTAFEEAVRRHQGPQGAYTQRKHIKRLRPHIHWLQQQL